MFKGNRTEIFNSIFYLQTNNAEWVREPINKRYGLNCNYCKYSDEILITKLACTKLLSITLDQFVRKIH